MDFSKHGISIKLILATSLLFFVSYIGVSVYSYESSQDKLVEKILESELPGSLDIVYQVIQNKLDVDTKVVSVMSEGILPELLSNDQDPESISTYLKRIKDRLSLTYLGVYTRTNYITVDKITGIDDHENRHYERLHQSQTIAYTVPEKETGKIILWVNHTVRGSDGEVLGSCQVGFSIDELTNAINKEITGEGNLLVIDQEGTIRINGDIKDKTARIEPVANRNIDEVNGLANLKAKIIGSEELTTDYFGGKR